jgi:hypothetical protein
MTHLRVQWDFSGGMSSAAGDEAWSSGGQKLRTGVALGSQVSCEAHCKGVSVTAVPQSGKVNKGNRGPRIPPCEFA